ncbi:CRISPR system precrRNA processing endoribonuclease RAMP protein Cas6 [uncultured Thiodictyon sp.]|uniref:CRISPR system precrRNA processing endoribonuclease RAMP protein Cas6 n=1 Tax=uncultured Thiodictyon sp. TaxID=1846217 RepID=UPI0025E727D0|nr:CRISPR system precrRNA processing endoribonuclease RAMP protein Cas6 [uncultured Thiodictyon sp.]
MDIEQPRLPLSLYSFRYLADADFRPAADPRGLWHGVFGLHLRRQCCVVPATDCTGCLLLHQCQYSYLFSGPRPPASDLMRRYDRVPVPHAFRIDQDYPEVVRAGEALAVSLVLVGEANTRLPLVIQALAAAGQAGLGPQRGRVWLHDVTQHLPDGRPPQLVGSHGRLLAVQPPEPPPTPPAPAAVRIRFRSPYKASGQAAGAGGFSLGPFLMALVRRASLLQYFYTGRQLEAPFDTLKAASERAQVIERALRHQSASRFAARHGQRVDTGGLIGHVDLDLSDSTALWPYLHLGQWLNVGKNASMGFGWYELLSLAG